VARKINMAVHSRSSTGTVKRIKYVILSILFIIGIAWLNSHDH